MTNQEILNKYFKRVDITKICPWFLDKCIQLVNNCKNRGVEYYAISGFRDPIEQDKLYAIGRTESLDRKKVTNAPAWTSFHNYGLALDLCRDADVTKDGLQPDWKKEDYKVLQEECHKLGLTSGLDFSSFPEAPHQQVPFAAGSTGDFKKIFINEGIEKVWEEALKNLKKSIFYKQFYEKY